MTTTTTEQRTLAAAIQANVPVILWGDPAVNKSAFIEDVFPTWGWHVETVIAGHRDPTDFNGLPVVRPDGNVHMAPPAWAVRANEAADNGQNVLVFLDEFSQAAPATQGAALRALRERWVGELKLHDNVRFVLAANPVASAAGGWELAAPTANRILHLDWKGVDVDTWVQGLIGGWDTITPHHLLPADPGPERRLATKTLVGTYISHSRNSLHDLPKDRAAAGGAWASRRSWDMLADVLAYIDENDRDAMLTAAVGLVGEGHGTAFQTWALTADLPDPRAVLEDPSVYDFTDRRLDRTFAVLASTAAVARNEGTRDMWDAQWAVFGAAAAGGRADVAVPHVLAHMRAIPGGQAWLPPREHLTAFAATIRDAGLLPELRRAA